MRTLSMFRKRGKMTKGGTRFTVTLPAVLLGIVVGFFSTPAFGQPFELDGNAVANGLPGTDWDVINAPGDSGLTEAETDLIVDRPEPNEAQFHGGGSKDELDITGWGWRKGAPPAKDDLTHAYAAAFDYEDHFYLVFGMDRYDTSGSAQLGFWFFQDTVAPIPNGTAGSWDGEHQVGDLLVLVNFTKGGDVPTIEVYQWDGVTAVQISPPDAALCTGGWLGGQDYCGITNSGEVTAPWLYEHKDLKGNSAVFPPGGFFEGAIDLTALQINDACFTTFLAESRSSASIDAVLKDFSVGGFPVCSINVTKECMPGALNEAETHITYPIRGMVTNDGWGTVHGVALTDNPAADGAFEVATCGDYIGTGNYFPMTSLTGHACYINTITVPLLDNGPSDTVTATAYSAPGSSGTLLDAQASADCPNLQVNPALSVEKKCRAEVVVLDNKVVAKVWVAGKVCNTGDTGLNNVTAYDLSIVTDPDPLVDGVYLSAPANPADPTVAEGACVEYTGSYYPSEANASCAASVVFNDTVEVTADDIFGAPLAPVTDSTDCNLCLDCAEYSD